MVEYVQIEQLPTKNKRQQNDRLLMSLATINMTCETTLKIRDLLLTSSVIIMRDYTKTALN